MNDQSKWDRYFLRMALEASSISKDPSTRVGAVIVGPDRELCASGFNGFPRRILDSPERLNDRDMKLRLVVHAERNAILAAARVGVPLKGCTLYVACTDSSGQRWGGNPCTACTIEVIQAGIVEVVSWPLKVPTRWADDLLFARELLAEAGVRYRTVDP